MIEFLGWLGFTLLVSTLMPFLLRRLKLWRKGLTLGARYHHHLALACLAVLTLHGFGALNGRRGWGARLNFQNEIISGIFAWMVLLAISMLALSAFRQKPFKRTHCWLVGLLVLLVLYHI
ncbi:ferric reductase-like transmembrane domain-containing protein [Desulfoscipio gibsoniae]|uniref:Ferric oxidoreductase domain-containing protein n=1 Tax=Desulfoscipio gibsoniae DSM 7213 TaxID=767817 RepID=R4KG37_9FIRM|nr:ferric reductase-like transmembrane domain-containing protein [Desulfoscipio gibsoniae]AGL02178.1 hypothetical protein Desgi_2776 [Desulfoscipio gibsoniae DSM 7213]